MLFAVLGDFFLGKPAAQVSDLPPEMGIWEVEEDGAAQIAVVCRFHVVFSSDGWPRRGS